VDNFGKITSLLPKNPVIDLKTLWTQTLGEIEVEIGKSNFNLFFKNSQLLSFNGGVAKLGFTNKAIALQTSQRYYALIQSVLERQSGSEKVSLLFESVDRPLLETSQVSDDSNDIGPLFASPKDQTEDLQFALKKARLRPDFTLEEFCVSTSNQLAFAAAQAVAKTPGKNYNPFFIWGGVGLGKTHLMQAIGQEILRQNPKSRVIYAPGEQFTNEIIDGIRTKNTKDFKEKYRSATALLIDDIQFLSGKDTVQEEFFYTFNAIQQNEGQIILTSDRKPGDIKDLADRLRSRFEGGLVADISTPDHELKTAICVMKAKKRGLELSNNLAAIIASNVDNIRSLEGTLQRITTEAEFKKTSITEDFIYSVLKIERDIETKTPGRVDGRIILDAVCEFYNLPMKIIKSEKRDRPISLPRQILMYLLKQNTSMTLIEIADFLGGRDHTTIMHGIRKIESLERTDNRTREEISSLTAKILRR
jgi:chromosomal replication initiator protein